jgi:hypothetical protein
MEGPSTERPVWKESRPGVGTAVGTWYASRDMSAVSRGLRTCVCLSRNSCQRFVEAAKYISSGGIFDLAYFGSIKIQPARITILQ